MDPRPYGPFPYLPINRRPKLSWPNGARVALWVVPNIEFFGLDEKMPGGSGKIPDVPTWGRRDYGNRIGIFRIMDVLSRYRVRATVALNSDLCAVHPDIIESATALDWEFMGHNESNTRRLNELDASDERATIRATLDTIEKATGRRPTGWLGSGMQETWNSLEYLREAGVQYVGDWVNDDQPYRMTVDGGEMISMPYAGEINDRTVIERYHRTSEEFADMAMRQFDVLYGEGAHSGRVMCIALHPFLMGVPHRIGALDRALAYICGHSDVWLATGSEIVDHYRKVSPAKG
jgi:peptidoglycan/xylan/chitin deacetylase (PgdA/CDA1 family)